MKNILFFVAGVMVATLILGVVGFAFAQSQTPPDLSEPSQGFLGGMMRRFGGRAFGMMGGWRSESNDKLEGPLHAYMVEAFAKALTMSAQELEEELDAGKTMWQVAQAKGYTQEEFTTVMIEARKNALKNAVADGVITQEQADWMIERMNQFQGSGFGFGYCHNFNGRGWRGMPGWRRYAQPTPQE